MYTVSQKTCDYIFYNNFNNKCPITIIFGIASLCVIERWFHFPPHLSGATTLPWEITEHKKWPISQQATYCFVNKQRSATRLIAGSICWDSKTSQLYWPFTFTPGLTNISSVIPTCDTATDTITDVRADGWDQCIASCYQLVHKPDRSAS